MLTKSYWLFYGVALCLALYTQPTSSMWDFAITTKSRILFYDDQWREVLSSAHQFDKLSALAFDETEEVIYFNDLLHNNGSIFSLKLPTSRATTTTTTIEEQHIIDKIVHRTQNETITGISYDPLNRNIYWADSLNRKIFFISIDATETQEPKVLLDFTNEDTIPDGIALDICRRKLYYTNSNFMNATVERVELDGTQREIIIKNDLYLPHGIVVDQLSDRIYFVVDQQGIHFSVESAKLDGSDRRVLVRGSYNVPLNLAVTNDGIFWTDLTHNSIWFHPKIDQYEEHQKQLLNGEDDNTKLPATTTVDGEAREQSLLSKKVNITFKHPPRGIIARSRFLTNMQADAHCADIVRKIKSRLLTSGTTGSKLSNDISSLTDEERFEREYCLNGGDYIKQSGTCICQIGFKGPRCGTNECFNYCVHGTCSMSSMGFPKCTCQLGFYGERCQSYKCSRYCFNDGLCKINADGEPSCDCQEKFGGSRCEQNSTEICALFCRILKHEPDTYVPFGCHDICEELAELGENGEMYAIPKYSHLEVCENTNVTWNSTVIGVLVCGVVLSLSLVLMIVHGVRRFYKPVRPRIKKTFVVRKQAAVGGPDTPLTNRPMATEQCEITIENCCNMNICDTPCFDPKLVQQTLSRDNNAKDDKKMLIHNMEDELY